MSDGDMVERVALAIPREGFPKGQESARDYRLRLARASIDAMKKPTEEMAIAGRKTSLYPARTFVAMIDAALTP